MNGNVLPLGPTQHIIFCVLSILFFIIQYLRQGYKYQILTVFALAGTFLIYANTSKAFFYGIGVFELIIMILIFITLTTEKKREERMLEAAQAKLSDVSESSEGDEEISMQAEQISDDKPDEE